MTLGLLMLPPAVSGARGAAGWLTLKQNSHRYGHCKSRCALCWPCSFPGNTRAWEWATSASQMAPQWERAKVRAPCRLTNLCPYRLPRERAPCPQLPFLGSLMRVHVLQPVLSLGSRVLGFLPFTCKEQRRQAPEPGGSALNLAPSSFKLCG